MLMMICCGLLFLLLLLCVWNSQLSFMYVEGAEKGNFYNFLWFCFVFFHLNSEIFRFFYLHCRDLGNINFKAPSTRVIKYHLHYCWSEISNFYEWKPFFDTFDVSKCNDSNKSYWFYHTHTKLRSRFKIDHKKIQK